MNRKIYANRVNAVILAVSIVLLLCSSLFFATKALPIFRLDCGETAAASHKILLYEKRFQSNVPADSLNCFTALQINEEENISLEEPRRDILFYFISLLLFFSYQVFHYRLWKQENSPPPLIQHKALLRFLKRADGRKRILSLIFTVW